MLDDLIEKPELPDRPDVDLEEPRIQNDLKICKK